MQFFWFFYTNTERYLLGKRTGVQSPANNKKYKNFIVLFPPSLCGLRQSFRPSGTLREELYLIKSDFICIQKTYILSYIICY